MLSDRCKRRRRRLAVVVSVTFCVAQALAEPEQSPPTADSAALAPATRAAVGKLIDDSVHNGKAYDYDEQLADMIGPRLTGSANYQHAVAWAEQQFGTLGLADVHEEEWVIPATWEPEQQASGHL